MLAPLIILISFLSLVLVQLDHVADDPGVGWHLMTGRYIADTGSIPVFDPFLASPTPRTWVADQWLSDLGFHFLSAWGSWPLVYATLIALFMVTFFGLFFPWLARTTSAPNLSALATMISFKMAQIHFIVRPVVLSFLLFTCLIVLIWPRREETLSRQRLFGIGILFLAWANLHPAFMLGFVLLGIRIVDAGVRRELRLALYYTGALVCALCATLLNPYGLSLHRSILALAGDPYFMNLHSEWLSPPLQSFEGALFYGSAAVLVALWGGTARIIPLRAFEVLGVGLFGYLTYDAVRVLPFFGLLCMPWITLRVKALLEARALRFPGLVRLLARRSISAGGLVLILCGLVVGDSLLRGKILTYEGPFGPHPDSFPYAAVKAILAPENPKSIAVAASPNFGGFLTWQSQGRIKPLIDDRNTLLGSSFYRRFDQEFRPGGAWDTMVREYQVQFLLLSAGSGLATALSREPRADISEFFRDDRFVVYSTEPMLTASKR